MAICSHKTRALRGGMRTNQQMTRLLKTLQVRDVILSPEMSSALEKGFVEEQGCVLFASEAHNTARTSVGNCFDETGYECFVNHVHITGLPEALEFAKRLTQALAERFRDRFVVILSFDGRDATVRFHKLRAGQPWLNDNLEGYKEEGIAVFDSSDYMNLDSLSDMDKAIVGQALRAAADGPFFPDWEFHTLFGLERSEVRAIADS